jgi:uncharacterized Zn-binding protein involved in type VI secretion
MTNPEVADGGAASNTKGSCECINSCGQSARGGPPAWRFGEVLTPHREDWPRYETDTVALGLY